MITGTLDVAKPRRRFGRGLLRGNRKGRSGRVILKLAGVLAVMCVVAYFGVTQSSADDSVEDEGDLSTIHRRLSGSASCNYSEEAQKWYWNLLYAAALLYSLLGLAIVCDDFFVASLETISDVLNLSEDVAGATFMAAGSSAPELFTSVVDTFWSKNSVGVGTIVGSAVFNILVIIAAAAAASPKALHIDWKPMMRDSSFYLVSIILLVIFISPDSVAEGCAIPPGQFQWYGALTLVLWYGAYILFMYKNKDIFGWLDSRFGSSKPTTTPSSLELVPGETNEQALERKQSVARAMAAVERIQRPPPTEADVNRVREVLAAREFLRKRGVLPPPSGTHAVAKRRLRAAIISVVAVNSFKKHIGKARPRRRSSGSAAGVGVEEVKATIADSGSLAVQVDVAVDPSAGAPVRDWLEELDPDMSRYADALIADGFDSLAAVATLTDEDLERYGVLTGHRRAPFAAAIEQLRKDQGLDGDDDDEAEEESTMDKVLGAFSYPWMLMFKTIPDCAEEAWEKWYVVTFIMSILWICAISFVLVEMATRIGCSIGVSPVLMGLTVLAAGTSVPDALGSAVAARQGMGDMAVGNAIGSNVFDICLGIGLPYFVKTAIVDSGSTVPVEAGNVTAPIIILLGTLVIVASLLAFNKWKLTRPIGVCYLVAYAGFVVYNVVAEATREDLPTC